MANAGASSTDEVHESGPPQGRAPKVSVIMPAHNAASFVAEAVASVLAQADVDLELIVVDDGSTDQTSNILVGYDDPRIRLLCQTKRGVSAARNAALDAACGRYVTFLDGDDAYLPGAVARLSRFLDRHWDCGVAYSDGYYCDEAGRRLMRLSAQRWRTPTGDVLEPIVSGEPVVVSIGCTMVRRSVLEARRIRFDEALAIGEDWRFWIDVARVAQFGYVDVPTCLYRVHGGSATTTTGPVARCQNLDRIHWQVLHADWFNDLTAQTRRVFLMRYLTDILDGETLRQQQVVASAPFGALAAPVQALLLRWMAAKYIAGNQCMGVARDFLLHAHAVCPSDRPTVALLCLLDASRSLTVGMVRAWHQVGRCLHRLRDRGRVRPQDAPELLRRNVGRPRGQR